MLALSLEAILLMLAHSGCGGLQLLLRLFQLLNPINQCSDQFIRLDELFKELAFELFRPVHGEAVQDGLDVCIGLLDLRDWRH